MVQHLTTITLKPKTPMICSTKGDGHWSSEERAVITPKIQMEMDMGEVEELTPCEGPQMFIHIKAYFTKKTWRNDDHGLIYTDSKWLKDFRKQFTNQFPTLAWMVKGIDYTEQGMQGSNYVSLSLYLTSMASIKRFQQIIRSTNKPR